MQGHKHTINEISVIIGKDKSVLSRELKRNSHKNCTYTGKHTQMLCDERKECFKRPRGFTRERGLNEYTNGLIRQYIPIGTDFDDYDDLYIKNIQHKINRRPREKLAFDTPIKTFFAYLNNKVALVC